MNVSQTHAEPVGRFLRRWFLTGKAFSDRLEPLGCDAGAVIGDRDESVPTIDSPRDAYATVANYPVQTVKESILHQRL
jgi:hypothetical protein